MKYGPKKVYLPWSIYLKHLQFPIESWDLLSLDFIKNCFLTSHLIIAGACALLNLLPSLFPTVATLSEASSPSPHHADPTSHRPLCHGRWCFLPSVSTGGLPAGQSAVRGPDGRPAWHLPLHWGWWAGVRLPRVPDCGLRLRELLCAGWVCGLQPKRSHIDKSCPEYSHSVPRVKYG